MTNLVLSVKITERLETGGKAIGVPGENKKICRNAKKFLTNLVFCAILINARS